jgi:integrase
MKATKPEKPYKTFPLTAHPNGTWCKKVKGVLYHFGGWSDPDAALAKYRHQGDALQAGREPDPIPTTDQLSMQALANEFLDSKELLVMSGDLSRRMHFDYLKATERVTLLLGRAKIVEHLKPKDFDDLRAKLAEGVSKVTLANRIRMARILFKFASDQDLIEKPLKFGQNFKSPTKVALRTERNEGGSKLFQAAELVKIIETAGVPLKAMILLGLNCGFGNTDVATLPLAAVDLKKGWINFPRPKTGIQRRAPLWPETIKALKLALACRPTPTAEEDAGLFFVTKYGRRFVRLGDNGVVSDAVAGAFAKILVALEMSGNNRNFYSLRRTFETIGGDSRDQVATDFVMGHSPDSDDMAAIYRLEVFDGRLIEVTNHVRKWLWPKRRSKKIEPR